MPSFKLMPKRVADEEEPERGGRINIRWVVYKMRKAINVEISKAPNSTNIVSGFFLSCGW